MSGTWIGSARAVGGKKRRASANCGRENIVMKGGAAEMNEMRTLMLLERKARNPRPGTKWMPCRRPQG